MMKYLYQTVLVATLVVGTAFPVLAHPKLNTSIPQKNMTVSAPETIELHFTEALMKTFSGAKLTMMSMSGMTAHDPMLVAVTVSVGANPKVMLIKPKKTLPAGTYRIDWRAVSQDTHPVTGKLSFTVKV